MEMIGKIKIDDTYYPGEDFYCDGKVEDELLEIVQNHSIEDFNRIIEERADWPTFYHLSKQRENIVEWLPIDQTSKVLEVGSGCGAITGILSKKAKEVHAVELSKKRTLINAHRNQTCDNVTINIGNFKDIEPHLSCDYDFIVLIGVFEYAQGYMGTEDAYFDFMNILKKHLSAKGRLVIAIENQFGLKYWAGCREDHLGTYFSGLEGYQQKKGIRTFTKTGLERILKANGIEQYSFYYPYPDYKFMTSLYSDEYLPNVGELCTNSCNYDRERISLFDETLVFDSIIKEQQFPLFSNSYMLVTGENMEIKYSKYSNQRNDEYSIRTDIIKHNNQWYVQKLALYEEGKAHIEHLKEALELLQKRYQGSKIEFNHMIDCAEDGRVQFEFVEGQLLEQSFDDYLNADDEKGFLKLFEEFFDCIKYNNGVEITNYDFIFSNIFVNNNKWIVIDYEWNEKKIIDANELAYRAFYCYSLVKKGAIKYEDKILEFLGMSKEVSQNIKHKEQVFQNKVCSKQRTKAAMRNIIGNPILTLKHIKRPEARNAMTIQIYEDLGEGFQAHNSYTLNDSKIGTNKIQLNVSKQVKNLRFDPTNCACIIEILDFKWNQKQDTKLLKKITSNGISVGANKFYFETSDPNITIFLKKLDKKDLNELEIVYQVWGVSNT